MPDQEVSAPETTGTEDSSPSTMGEAYEAALQQMQGTDAEGAPPEQAPETATEGTPADAGTAAEEPEHIRWVRSIQGDVDPQTGQIIPDRVAKRAFELNRQNQQAAQKFAQLNAALQHPEIRAAILRAAAGQQAPPPAEQQPQQEKTDEQVLEEFVQERIARALRPIVPEIVRSRNDWVQSQSDTVYMAIREEFGKNPDGSYVYDEIAPDIGAEFNAWAQRAGTTRDALVAHLAKSGELYPAVQRLARSYHYPRLLESRGRAATDRVEAQKRTRLSPARQSSPAGHAAPPPKINSFEDAAAAAAKELGIEF